MDSIKTSRWDEAGTRPVRIANVSGGRTDPGYQMYRQATRGDVDFITGDYLAEVNIAVNAEAFSRGQHDGWEPSALEGIQMSLGVISEKRIKVIVNGGAHNPAGLARRIQALVTAQHLDLKVAYVFGDNILPQIKESLAGGTLPAHLDSVNEKISLAHNVTALTDFTKKYAVSANAYLGARAIVKGLEAGADIIICGRVSDASLVVGAAWWWHRWSENDYDELAHALIAGHMLECSGYVTGGNYTAFYQYPLETVIDVGFPIGEIARDGTVTVTKHEGTNGVVNVDTCKSQLLYEIQGHIYLNSDVQADIQHATIVQSGKDRVTITGIKGFPPPETTKLAIFYHAGFTMEFSCNAAGYATDYKWKLFRAQTYYFLKLRGFVEEDFEVLDIQVLGTPAADPEFQFAATTWGRVFAQADTQEPLIALYRALQDGGQQHFSGFHGTWDKRTVVPRAYLAYYPALYAQELLDDGVAILQRNGSEAQRISARSPPKYQQIGQRANCETTSPIDLSSLETVKARLGDVVLARSGDKAANVNIGLFVTKPEQYPWLRTYLTRERMKALMGKDWKPEFFIERCEFPNLLAVHFVIYGVLGRGVSSCRLLDSLGKGFADFIRDRVVDMPKQFLEDVPKHRFLENVSNSI